MELLLERAGDVTVAVLKAEYLDGNTSRDFKERMAALPAMRLSRCPVEVVPSR